MAKSVEEEIIHIKGGIQTLYKLSFVIWILMMQCGFAFLEAGSVRSKNTTTILFKNLLDMVVGSLSFWAFGFSFIMGRPGNGFIGHNHYFGTFLMPPINHTHKETPSNHAVALSVDTYYPEFIYHLAFAVTSSTIVSGAIAERAQFGGYIVYTIMISGFVYPCVAHWGWSDLGWLHTGAGTGIRFKDFAGSAIVHVVGGAISLIGVILIGPREGRFLKKRSSNVEGLLGHSVPFVSLGGFILIVGFLAFNGGSLPNLTDENAGTTLAMVIMNTLLSGASGTLVAMFLKLGFNKLHKDRVQWSLLNALNGCLAGMVAICAGADTLYPWAAVVTGILAGFVYIFVDILMEKLKLDDALSAVAVHLGGGLVGIITAPILSFKGMFINDPNGKGIIYDWSAKSFKGWGWNIFGTICIITWSMVLAGILFLALKLIGMLRITIRQERAGVDVEHHEIAYPETNKMATRNSRGAVLGNNKVHPA